jgi:hypothetical protein
MEMAPGQHIEPEKQLENSASSLQANNVVKQKKLKKGLWIVFIGLAVLLIGFGAFFVLRPELQDNQASQKQQPAQAQNISQKVDGLQLDPTTNYGNTYADGILPVGDGRYTTDEPEKGKVYLCNADFVPATQAGAQSRGPWFIGTTQWNINKKYSVNGHISWDQQMTNTLGDSRRIITTNNLPSHTTGIFPVVTSDPAYQYDRNPNTIKSQSLTYSLAGNPSYGEPQCMGGEVGILLTGVALFNAFDAGGRDAGAWEIQDACEGHPQGSGIYHYHTLSNCIKDIGVNSVIGFALDGFPITGSKVGENNFLTTDDLDECHGITSEVTLDGNKITIYHYVMTQDFPYSVSCFRATAIQPPGQHVGNGQQRPPKAQSQPASASPPRP